MLGSHRWRNLTSGPLGPYDEKRTLAIRWINQSWAYAGMLEEYFKNIRLEPETLQKLPFNGNGQYSAEECLRRLELQEAALDRLLESESESASDETVEVLQNSAWQPPLQRAVDDYGYKEVCNATGLDRGTPSNLVNGKTRNPHKKTAAVVEKYLRSLS